MLSHDEFDKKMTEAARRGENLFVVLSAAADHFLDCQKCQKNIAGIVEAVFLEAELKQDSEIDPADLSQEEVWSLLQFPSFDLSFLSGTPTSPEKPVQRTDKELVRTLIAGLSNAGYPDSSGKPKAVSETNPHGEEIAPPSEMRPSDKRESPRASAKEETIAVRPASSSTAQFSQQRMTPNSAAQLITKAVALEESGNLTEAQFTYEIARTQLQSDDTMREDLDTKIRELRHRIRIENRLDHEARAAQNLEKNGKWREAEDTYRRLATETISQRRHEEFKRAEERCHVEMEIADLFDSAQRAYKTKDLVGAMNRLKRVIHQRPGYIRKGVAAEVLLAQVRKELEARFDQASRRGAREFRLVLAGGLVLIFLLVVGIWNSAVPHQPLANPAPNAATVTLISPDALPSQPVAPSGGILPARSAIPMVTAVAKTPTAVSPHPP